MERITMSIDEELAEAFDELIRAEIPKWQRVVKDLGLKVE